MPPKTPTVRIALFCVACRLSGAGAGPDPVAPGDGARGGQAREAPQARGEAETADGAPRAGRRRGEQERLAGGPL
eukprot:13185-Pyramimonas_sp.AAC.1